MAAKNRRLVKGLKWFLGVEVAKPGLLSGFYIQDDLCNSAPVQTSSDLPTKGGAGDGNPNKMLQTPRFV